MGALAWRFVDGGREEWVVRNGGAWSVSVLPYGVVRRGGGPARPAVAVGDDVVDLAGLARDGALDGTVADPVATFDQSTLAGFLAAGSDAWQAVRTRLRELTDPDDAAGAARLAPHRARLGEVIPVLAWSVADYVDFYSSREHAGNVGRIFRPQAPSLPDAWDHLPIGYHGRAGTVVVSGTPIVRPRGLSRDPGSGEVVAGPSRRLDVEVEVGWVVGAGSTLGEPVPTTAFADHVFGAVLLNDWSARDLQQFEYRPLGPFLGKSFATSVSAWIVPLDALDGARVAPPPPPYPPLGHLAPAADGYDLRFELLLRPGPAGDTPVDGSADGASGAGAPTVLSRPGSAGMRWTPAQQLAHLTSNGASLRTGDLLGSGTVSGPDDGQWGSLLELSWGWRDDVRLDDGSSRRDGLADGDEVTIRGHAPAAGGGVIPLGEVTGHVLPAR